MKDIIIHIYLFMYMKYVLPNNYMLPYLVTMGKSSGSQIGLGPFILDKGTNLESDLLQPYLLNCSQTWGAATWKQRRNRNSSPQSGEALNQIFASFSRELTRRGEK